MFRAMVKAKGMAAKGEQIFSPGTHTFTVPDNVEYIACVCIGGGGGGSSNYLCEAGDGGSLAYGTIKVSPGQQLTVVVGDGGSAGAYNPGGLNDAGGNGGASSISRSGTTLIQAKGGAGGDNTNSDTNILAAEVSRKGSYAGGSGASGANGRFSSRGPGGGGAAGYAGNGGNGATGDGSAGSGGGGGGGAGGKWLSGSFSPFRRQGGYGGGVSLYGQGTSGAGGIYDTANTSENTIRENDGSPGSHDQGTDSGQSDQEYGGGGPTPAGANSIGYGFYGYAGREGAVRIVWPGRSRRYPSTKVAK